MRYHRLAVVCGPLISLVLLLTACGLEVTTIRPLIGAEHHASVLVEEKHLSHPRSVEQNRLLRGWRFVREDDRRIVVPSGSESVVEFINLGTRARSLAIGFADHAKGNPSFVRVRHENQDLGSFPVSDHLDIEIPNTLPIGRVALTLEFSQPESVRIERISISPVVTSGGADIDEDRIVQRGWSMVEVTRWADVGDRLVVEFQPPDAAAAGQRFAVTLEDSLGGLRKPFVWETQTGTDTADGGKIDVSLVDKAGPVRIRLLAQGDGPAGRWLDPKVVGSKPPASRPPDRGVDEPPRLVVLYVMDALRADHVGHLGPHAELTPTLDRLAAGGATFANHFAVAPNTPPSTRALFSGLCMLDDRQLPSPGPTRLAEVFRDAGYRTISITGNPHLAENLDLGTGFESVEMLLVKEDHHPKHPPTINNSAEILHEAALRWIDTLGPQERGFLYIHSMNPHNPYTAPLEFTDTFAPSGISLVDGRTRTLVAIRDLQREVTSDDIAHLRNLYAAGVAYNDAELGSLLDEIDRRSDPGQTFVAMTSDHGEELFEHGGVLHGFSLYDEMLRIPLILRWSGRLVPRRIDALTDTRDLHATMVELVGGSADDSSGSSLLGLTNGADAPNPEGSVSFAAAPGLAGAVMARSSRWKLIRVPRNGPNRGMGKGRGRSRDVEYVFDLVDDPEEQHNLAGIDDLEVAWLRSRLTAWLSIQETLQPTPGDQVMDDETKDQLEALGYIIDR